MEKLPPEDKHKELKADIDVAGSIENVAASRGGKVLINALVKDAVSTIDTLMAKHQELTLQAFVGLCADLKTKVDLIRSLTRAKKNRENLQAILADALKE